MADAINVEQADNSLNVEIGVGIIIIYVELADNSLNVEEED